MTCGYWRGVPAPFGSVCVHSDQSCPLAGHFGSLGVPLAPLAHTSAQSRITLESKKLYFWCNSGFPCSCHRLVTVSTVSDSLYWCLNTCLLQMLSPELCPLPTPLTPLSHTVSMCRCVCVLCSHPHVLERNPTQRTRPLGVNILHTSLHRFLDSTWFGH